MYSSAIDQKTGEKVAVKKLHRPFQSLTHAKRAYRELRLLKHNKQENVICLLNVFSPEDYLHTFQSFYLVMPFVERDLSHILKRQKLSESMVVFLLYQILCGLKYIHSAGIVHRARNYVCSLTPKQKKDFQQVFPTMNKQAVDLLEKMLHLDPDERITACNALAHPYLIEHHDPDNEPVAEPYDDSFENLDLKIEEWKSLLHMEITTFDPDNPRQMAT
ncbi:hypothetical protein chiPu_0008586 [Chiloscyllium punctatum]|uniref:mitogen-activated protein kinase n=1 Tax=Chiloscyllium punctatum TaxID=137246 RepID=A0A401SIA2_CHIPU|nr:hypothetical protein [Chiloscyllium punctatum]